MEWKGEGIDPAQPTIWKKIQGRFLIVVFYFTIFNKNDFFIIKKPLSIANNFHKNKMCLFCIIKPTFSLLMNTTKT